MKRYRLFLLALLAPLFLSAGAWAITYEQALGEAKKTNKPVALYFRSESCYYCIQMEKSTLADKEINAILNKDFVFVMIDVDKRGDLMRTYPLRGTPTSTFLDAGGKPVFSVPGAVNKANYKIVLDYVRGGHYKNTEFSDYLKKARKEQK